jgi:hypothetical protein
MHRELRYTMVKVLMKKKREEDRRGKRSNLNRRSNMETIATQEIKHIVLKVHAFALSMPQKRHC